MRFSPRTPLALRRAPRGGGIFNLIGLIATIILTGGIGLGILGLIDASSCTVNVFWGCGSNVGTNINGSTVCASAPNSCGQRNVGTLTTTYSCPSGYTQDFNDNQQCYSGTCGRDKNGSLVAPRDKNGAVTGDCQIIAATQTQSCSAPPPSNSSCPAPCTSAPNACGQTSTGTIVNGSCNATPPSNASCPQPRILTFYPTPSTIGPAGSGSPSAGKSTLTWQTNNTTSCSITGDNGFSANGGSSGSVQVSGLTQTTTFTLTCANGAGGPKLSRSVKVIIDPHYKEK